MAWKVPYFAQMKIVHNTDLIQMDLRTEKKKLEEIQNVTVIEYKSKEKKPKEKREIKNKREKGK